MGVGGCKGSDRVPSGGNATATGSATLNGNVTVSKHNWIRVMLLSHCM
jgi:hypothetical protein